jgi:predicted kinase
MIIAMAGLPGTGKSTLAKELVQKLTAILLNKDKIRAALFSPENIEYSADQDDFVFDIMLQVVAYSINRDPSQAVILDGRTFMKRSQVEVLKNYCEKYGWDLKVIYCTCSDEVARARLERDVAHGTHLATDRNFSLYARLKSQIEELQVLHLHVDTGEPLEKCVRQCLDYLMTDPA